ncbi:MAG: phosphate ABC transporter permease PstA [Veillonellaceae bacterium]|nr:phosphate ABC transporter permease PstA [Veillonellaceae bacterium]
MSAKQWDRIVTGLLWGAGLLIIGVLAMFLGYILLKGLPVLSASFIFGPSSDVSAGGGVGGQLFNTFYILFLSLLVAAPVAVGAGIYLAEYSARGRLADLIRLSVECLASVPSIVLGLFGMILFINLMGFGISLGVGAMTLALMNLPIIVRVTEEALKTVPREYREASLALGATKWQTIARVVLPAALPGIVTGVTLTAGRAVGETAILIFTSGTTASRLIPDFSLAAGGETLAVHMWYVMAIGLVPDRVDIANGTGALLILVILTFNLILASSTKHLRKWLTGM